LKYSKKFFGFISVLGLLFLIIFFVGCYLKELDSINILASLSSELFLILVFGGIAFFSIGIIGIVRLRLKNHRNLFTAIAAFAVPTLTFVVVFFGFILIIAPGSFRFPMRSEITKVAVVSNSPLVLSVDVKALTTRNAYIEGAYILSIDDSSIVTDCYLNPPFFVLPAYSTKTFSFNFNVTIPSGDYILMLSAWRDAHGSLQFIIP